MDPPRGKRRRLDHESGPEFALHEMRTFHPIPQSSATPFEDSALPPRLSPWIDLSSTEMSSLVVTDPQYQVEANLSLATPMDNSYARYGAVLVDPITLQTSSFGAPMGISESTNLFGQQAESILPDTTSQYTPMTVDWQQTRQQAFGTIEGAPNQSYYVEESLVKSTTDIDNTERSAGSSWTSQVEVGAAGDLVCYGMVGVTGVHCLGRSSANVWLHRWSDSVETTPSLVGSKNGVDFL